MKVATNQKALSKWHVLFGGFISYMFDAMDITLLAVTLPSIMKELNMTMGEGGLLGTATLLGIGLSSVAVGWYADNYGRRKALICSLIAFGILTAAIAFANSWLTILILRFSAGFGLGGVWGIIAAYISETWPAHQRGRAAAFVLSSFPAGAGLSAFLAAVMLPTFGWRSLFLTGAGSLIGAAYIYFFVPESEAWRKQKEEQVQRGEDAKVSIGEIFSKDLWKITVLATMTASFSFMAYWGATTWIPTFLVKERHLDFKTMSYFFLVLNIGMFIGYNVFGYLADLIGRKKSLILSFLGTAVTLPMYVMAESQMALFWLGPLYAFFVTFVGIFGSYFGELYPIRVRTLGAGFCFNVGRGFSAFAPFVLGVVATKYGLSTGINICAVFFAASAVVMLFLPDTNTKKTV